MPTSMLPVCRPRSAMAGVQRNARTARLIHLLDGSIGALFALRSRAIAQHARRGESSISGGG